MYAQAIKSAAQNAVARRLDAQINQIWDLGRNIILGWTRQHDALIVLACPNYFLPDYCEEHANTITRRGEMPRALLVELTSDPRFAVHRIAFEQKEALGLGSMDQLDRIIRRYGISLVEQRAVVLFDIVGYSKLTDLQRVAQLNSLSYSVNIAHKRLTERGIEVDLARSTTGDGFYMWNREEGAAANIRLFALTMLALADNALGLAHARRSVVPRLRTAYHIGSHFEFYQSVGHTPDTREYIVGDSTITLARFLERALPGQLVIGDFGLPDGPSRTPAFLAQSLSLLSNLSDLEISHAKVTRVQTYLTGARIADGSFAPTRFIIADKHKFRLPLFNARCVIDRERGEKIFVGLPEAELGEFRAERTAL
jgi:hypothetical protein